MKGEELRRDLELWGITGCIAAGKSRVADWLHRHGGVPLINVDLLGRSLLQPGAEGYFAMVERYGSRFLEPSGLLDRLSLRKELFADPELKGGVEALLHPLIRQAMLAEAERLAQAGQKAVWVEVPLLYEAGWEGDFSLVIAVTATREQCLERLRRRDGVSLGEAREALLARFSQQELVARADVVVDNSGSWKRTKGQLKALLDKLQLRKSEGWLENP